MNRRPASVCGSAVADNCGSTLPGAIVSVSSDSAPGAIHIDLPTTGIFFSSDRASALVLDATSWLGTPFKRGMAMKHVGADCAYFIAALLTRAGVFGPQQMPAYQLDEGRHSLESKAVNALRATGRFFETEIVGQAARLSVSNTIAHEPFTFSGQLIGDVLGFDCGKSIHHLGIVISQSTFIHAALHYGVRGSLLADPMFAPGLRRVFRAKSVAAVCRPVAAVYDRRAASGEYDRRPRPLGENDRRPEASA